MALGIVDCNICLLEYASICVTKSDGKVTVENISVHRLRSSSKVYLFVRCPVFLDELNPRHSSSVWVKRVWLSVVCRQIIGRVFIDFILEDNLILQVHCRLICVHVVPRNDLVYFGVSVGHSQKIFCIESSLGQIVVTCVKLGDDQWVTSTRKQVESFIDRSAIEARMLM